MQRSIANTNHTQGNLLPQPETPQPDPGAPQYHQTLSEIPVFRIPLAACESWRRAKGHTLDTCETVAYAVLSKWPGPTRSPYRNPWATFQNWVRREVGNNNGTNGHHQAGTPMLPPIPKGSPPWYLPYDASRPRRPTIMIAALLAGQLPLERYSAYVAEKRAANELTDLEERALLAGEAEGIRRAAAV